MKRLLLGLALALGLAACGSSGVDRVEVVEVGAQPTSCAQQAAMVREWRGRLALRDWTIRLHCAPDPDYGDEADGTISFFAEGRTADLWIHPAAQNKELTIVHELLHLIFDMTCQAESDLVEEQQLRAVAVLLVPGG